jgi:hypothetical protein
VFHVDRFHNLFGAFEAGEGKNSEKALALGLKCGRSAYPFMCWLPYPLAFRGGKKSIRHRVFEGFGRSGFHPIDFLDEVAAERFISRDPMYS